MIIFDIELRLRQFRLFFIRQPEPEVLQHASPDLNPIGPVLPKLKALLRQTAARTYETLWRTVGQLMDRFQADECLNFFRHSGDISD
ncbi:hypothetical protein [Methylobacter sp. YRD-M1]|uniref:hypothetical protein n=1 Tax=Methylobacter sp. YRD-M1 TaxID=2911520 RepID=UPI003FA3D47A